MWIRSAQKNNTRTPTEESSMAVTMRALRRVSVLRQVSGKICSTSPFTSKCAAPAALGIGARNFSASPGMLEWRSYKIKFSGMEEFMKLTEGSADLRKALHPKWKGFFTCDTGGCLTTVHHMYHYSDMVERKEVRDKASLDDNWKAYRKAIGPYVQDQVSSIFKPAVACMEAAGSAMIQDFHPEPEDEVMYEMRRYQLHPGYDNVPRLLDSFAKGLPHKVAADSNSKLVFFGYIDVGMLNTVIEVWRYPSLAASIRARESARKVTEWKKCIGAGTPLVQHFQTQALFPANFSPLH